MAMMATGSGNNTNNHYDPYDNDADLIDPDDGRSIQNKLISNPPLGLGIKTPKNKKQKQKQTTNSGNPSIP